jgi:hypothetical protein
MIAETAAVLELAQELGREWQESEQLADVLSTARDLRDAVARLIPTIERAWPNRPPPDPAGVLVPRRTRGSKVVPSLPPEGTRTSPARQTTRVRRTTQTIPLQVGCDPWACLGSGPF